MSESWRAEGKLPNGGVKLRHIPTRCLFDVWVQSDQICALLRQGAAASNLFDEAKQWYKIFGKEQPDLF